MERPELEPIDQYILSIYQKVVCPTNYTIDWSGFLLWCQLENLEDYHFMSTMILEVRSIVIELSNRKYDNKNNKNLEKKSNSMLSKKFGG